MIELIFWTSLFLLSVVYLVIVVRTFLFGVPFYPTSNEAISSIISELKMHKVTIVAELGSGDGRVAFALAKAGFKVTGYEINPFLSLLSKLVAKIRRYDVKILNKSFLSEDLTGYDAYVMYLFPHLMDKLEPKLFTKGNNNSVIISNTFTFKGKEPVKKLSDKILVYVVKK